MAKRGKIAALSTAAVALVVLVAAAFLKPTGLRARWRRLLGLAGVLVAVAPVFAIAYAYYTADEPPPYDADLALEPRTMPAEENGFVTLMELIEADIFWKARSGDWRVVPGQIEHMVNGEAWDSTIAKSLLERNPNALVQLDRALQQPHFTDPGPENEEAGELDFLSLLWLRNVQAIRTWSLLFDGKEREAFAEALKIVRLGARIYDSRGAFLPQLMGGAIKSFGVETMDRIHRRTKLAPGDLAAVAAALRGLITSSPALVDSIKAQYAVRSHQLDSIARGEGGLDSYYGPEGIAGFLFWGRKGPCFKPNQTKRMLADHTRSLIAKLEGSGSGQGDDDLDARGHGPEVDRRWPSRNVVGRYYVESTYQGLQRFIERRRTIDARIMVLADSLAR